MRPKKGFERGLAEGFRLCSHQLAPVERRRWGGSGLGVRSLMYDSLGRSACLWTRYRLPNPA